MKRKKLMQLLAVVMAASLAVTSQGIPSGLTAVEAAVETKSALTAGHLYQEVTQTKHEHESQCYTDGAAVNDENYFVKITETEYKALGEDVVEGTGKVAVTSGTTTTFYKKVVNGTYVKTHDAENDITLTLGANQRILATAKGGDTYKLYDCVDATAAQVPAIEVAWANKDQANKVASTVVYLTKANQTAFQGTYDSADSTTPETGTNLNGTTAISESGAYYTVLKYAKVKEASKTVAKDYPGAIVMTSSDQSSKPTEYTTELGFETTVTEGDVYIPFIVSDYELSKSRPTAGDTQQVGSGDDQTTWTAVVEDGSVTWTKPTEATQPAGCYVLNATKTAYVLQVVELATAKDGDYTYSYKENGTTDKALTESEVIKVGEKYYTDVTGKYVTKIEPVNTGIQYILEGTTADQLTDDVKLTFGDGTTQTVEASNVTISSYQASGTTYTDDNGDLTISAITTDYVYAIDKDGDKVIADSDIAAISSIDFSALSTNGYTTINATYKVRTVTAPSITLAASNLSGTPYTSQVDSKPTYKNTVTVTKPSDISGTEGWTFQWKDQLINKDNGVESTSYSGATAQTYDNLGEYTITSANAGHHKVSLVAYYNNSTDPLKEYTALEFYVLKEVNADAGKTLVAGDDTNKQTVSVSGLLAAYADGGNFSDATLTADPNTNVNGSISFVASGKNITYQLTADAAEGNSIAVTGEIYNGKYIVSLKLAISVIADGATVKDMSSLQSQTIYYGDDTDYDTLKTAIVNDSGNETYYTVTFGDDETKTVPIAVGTTIVYVTYVNNATVGSASTSLIVAKKKLTLTANNLTITKGGNLSSATYTVQKANGTKEVNSLSGTNLTATAKVFSGSTDVTSKVSSLDAGEYTLTYEVTETGTDNYEVAITPATLTVKKSSGGGNNGNSNTNSNSNSNNNSGTATTYTVKENTDGSKTIVDESGKAVVSSKVTATDGKSYVTDKDGKVVTDSKVTTADGKTYITDEDGVVQTGKVAFEGKQYITGSDGAILTDQVAETPSGNKVYVDENGAIVKNKTITGSDGKRYLATKSGKLATDGFYITPSGNKVYATASGALKTGKVFTVHGKKYYAKASGAIATTGFTKTAAGNTVYATKSGAIKVNKAFKASNGKKYVADKNGKIVKGKKYTIGNKTYTTNKKGVITKVTTKKK
jgi:hypothetical protein